MSGPLFAKRVDVSSQNFVKPRNREIWSYDDRIALTFIRHLDSSAVETSVNFQSGWKSFNPNLATSRLHEILRWDGLPLDTVIKSGHVCLTLNSTAPRIEMWIHQELKNDKNENLMLILDNYGHSVELLCNMIFLFGNVGCFNYLITTEVTEIEGTESLLLNRVVL